jgi:hypothetical protein
MFSVKIEHALKEWENGKKAYKVAFSEDSAKQRFNYLLAFEIYLLIFISVMVITWVIGKGCRLVLLHGSSTGKIT